MLIPSCSLLAQGEAAQPKQLCPCRTCCPWQQQDEKRSCKSHLSQAVWSAESSSELQLLVLSSPEMMLCSTLCLSMASRYRIHSPTVQGQFLTARSWADKTNSFTFSCLSWKNHTRKVKLLSATETTWDKPQLIKSQQLNPSTFILYSKSSDGYFKFCIPKYPVNTLQWGRACSGKNYQASEVSSAKEINIIKALSEFPTVPRMSRIQRRSTPSLFVEVLFHLQPAVSSWEEKEMMEKLSLDKLLQGVSPDPLIQPPSVLPLELSISFKLH